MSSTHRSLWTSVNASGSATSVARMRASWIPVSHSPRARAWSTPHVFATARMFGMLTPSACETSIPTRAIPGFRDGSARSSQLGDHRMGVHLPEPYGGPAIGFARGSGARCGAGAARARGRVDLRVRRAPGRGRSRRRRGDRASRLPGALGARGRVVEGDLRAPLAPPRGHRSASRSAPGSPTSRPAIHEAMAGGARTLADAYRRASRPRDRDRASVHGRPTTAGVGGSRRADGRVPGRDGRGPDGSATPRSRCVG